MTESNASVAHRVRYEQGFLEQLNMTVEANDAYAFCSLINDLDWALYQPASLLQAIRFAVSLNLVQTARSLAATGQRLFPDDADLQQAARVLAPPAVHQHPASAPQGIQESNDWLRDHAHEYRGQWVAVNQGAFLGAATSFKELRSLIEQAGNPDNAIVLKVP